MTLVLIVCGIIMVAVTGCSKAQPQLTSRVDANIDESTSSKEVKPSEPPVGNVANGVQEQLNVPRLVEQLKSQTGYPRREALQYLGKAGAKAAIAKPEVVKCLTDGNVLVRIYAATALKQIDPSTKDALPVLLDALRTKDETARCYAAGAFKVFDPSAIPSLIELFREDDQGTASWASVSVAQFGKKAIPMLRKAQQDQNPLVRKNAEFALEIIELSGE